MPGAACCPCGSTGAGSSSRYSQSGIGYVRPAIAELIIIVIASAIWVAFDAPSRGLPWVWALGVALLWIVAFPWYLVVRQHHPVLTRRGSHPPSSAPETDLQRLQRMRAQGHSRKRSTRDRSSSYGSAATRNHVGLSRQSDGPTGREIIKQSLEQPRRDRAGTGPT